jgi:uncharacterized protein (DUF362 family)
MKNRREFLQAAATGAVLLGSKSKLGLAGVVGQHDEAGRSKVVVARDASLHGASGQPDEQKVIALLDKAIATYTGREHPVEAWQHILRQGGGEGQVIGLKTNGLGGRGISSHAVLVMAICQRLQQAGVKAGNIVIWDRAARDLMACGLTINTDPSHGVRCFGSDVSGYEDQPAAWGSAHIRLSKILTRECGMVIGVPILKDHNMAGVTFAMKNMYGVVDRPQDLHANNCNPAVADLNCIPVIRQKVCFTVGDALSSVYEGGPVFHPERLWYPNALIVGADRVALDHTAWQMIARKRAEMGVPTLEAAGRPPLYIAAAADAAHRLGTNDPERINLMEV